MKKIILSCSAFAFAFCAVNVSAQEAAPLQPKGTWYLGSADATSLFQMFSADGVDVDPFVGYAIADDIAITVGLNYGSVTTNAVDAVPGVDAVPADSIAGTPAIPAIPGTDAIDEYTASSMELSLGAAYFFGDNYYAQAQLVLGSVDTGSGDAASSTGYSIGVGKFIPVKDMWFISPEFNYSGNSDDLESSAGAEIRIRFGATF